MKEKLKEGDRKKMVRLREHGLSYRSIGKLFHMTGMRVHQLVSDVALGVDTYRLAKFRAKSKCEWCWNGNPAVSVHYIDGDQKNTDINNLLLVCVRCFAEFGGETRLEEPKKLSTEQDLTGVNT